MPCRVHAHISSHTSHISLSNPIMTPCPPTPVYRYILRQLHVLYCREGKSRNACQMLPLHSGPGSATHQRRPSGNHATAPTDRIHRRRSTYHYSVTVLVPMAPLPLPKTSQIRYSPNRTVHNSPCVCGAWFKSVELGSWLSPRPSVCRTVGVGVGAAAYSLAC